MKSLHSCRAEKRQPDTQTRRCWCLSSFLTLHLCLISHVSLTLTLQWCSCLTSGPWDSSHQGPRDSNAYSGWVCCPYVGIYSACPTEDHLSSWRTDAKWRLVLSFFPSINMFHCASTSRLYFLLLRYNILSKINIKRFNFFENFKLILVFSHLCRTVPIFCLCPWLCGSSVFFGEWFLILQKVVFLVY